MRYGSVCSGIEAATVAWHGLGWQPVYFSEIAAFPSAVLAHHYPGVPNMGDMTRHKEWTCGPIDLLVGGTPCQSFSTAGLRKGLDDPRGSLMLTFLAIAERQRPRWIVWENVPGVLSSGGGRDFGAFLGALGHLGYGWAYRVLDAQWFGVAQRRRRVFVVGCLGDQRAAAAVLFEREKVRRDPAPCRKAREETARCITSRVGGGGGMQQPLAFSANMSVPQVDVDLSQTLQRKNPQAVAMEQPMQVRRLTPRECERLQGFPDDYTAIPYRGKAAADGPRYTALGNSMAVPVMRWIGQRISAAAQGLFGSTPPQSPRSGPTTR